MLAVLDLGGHADRGRHVIGDASRAFLRLGRGRCAGCASISSNSSGPAMSGGDSWMTGSPRSSARQIRPALEQPRRDEAAQQPLALVGVNRPWVVRVLHELDGAEVARRRGRRRRSEVAQASSAARNSASLARTLPRIPSRSKMSRLASADRAAHRMTGERDAVGEAGRARRGTARRACRGAITAAERRVAARSRPWRW